QWNYCSERPLFVVIKPTNDAVLFLFLSHEPGGVVRYFAVPECLSKNQAEECTITIRRCGRVRVRGEPRINFFGLDRVRDASVESGTDFSQSRQHTSLVPMVRFAERLDCVREGGESNAINAPVVR